MRCKNCGFCTNKTKYKCWEKWQLCADCAVKLHPEEYDNNIKNKGTFHKLSNPLKTSINPRKICSECGNTVLRMWTHYSRTTNKTGCHFCIKCRIVFVFDSRVRVAKPMEALQ
jgi:hypothetical protein